MGILLPWLQKLSSVQDDVKKLHDFFFCWKPLCWVSLNYLEFPISCCSPCLEKFHSKEKFCSVSLCVRSAGSFTALFPQGIAIKNSIVKFVHLMFQDEEQKVDKLSISQSALTLMYTMVFAPLIWRCMNSFSEQKELHGTVWNIQTAKATDKS